MSMRPQLMRSLNARRRQSRVYKRTRVRLASLGLIGRAAEPRSRLTTTTAMESPKKDWIDHAILACTLGVYIGIGGTIAYRRRRQLAAWPCGSDDNVSDRYVVVRQTARVVDGPLARER